MKTRNLLLAMALPTLFAACTAEEIVNQADNNVLETRALLGDLSVKIENPVASRAAWNDATLKWGEFTEEDVFSGAVVDATRGTVANNLLTNYIYKDNNGAWETTSQMVEGIYSFYSYQGIATKNDRKPVAFDLTAQKADLDNPTKVIDDNQLFFSPLYNIEAKNTTAENTIALPLTFYPYHSIGAMKMTNETGQTLLITEIIANGQFAAKGAIMPTQINAAKLNWSVRKGESAYKLQAKKTENGVATEEYSATEIEKMWQTADLDNIDTDGAGTKDSGTELPSSVLTMNCGNWEWADGKEIMAYMVVPAGAKITSIDIRVVDEEGEAKLIKVAQTKQPFYDDNNKAYAWAIPSTGIESITFKRSVPVSIFGYTSGNLPKGVVAKANNLADASGYYIDNKEALINLINISRGDILVYNFGNLAVDAEIAEIVAEYTGGEVTFTNPIDIKDTEEVSISNMKFDAGVTVKGADTATGFEGTTAVFESATAEKLTIEAGATVIIKGGTYKEIVNKGTLSVEAQIVSKVAVTVDVRKITNEGALTVKGQDVANVVLTKGSVSYEALDLDADGSLTDETVYTVTMPTVGVPGWSMSVGTGVKMTINALPYANVYNKDADGVVTTSTITNAGEINVAGATYVWGLTNTGVVSGTNHMVICGTASNSGKLNCDYLDVMKGATLSNYGEVKNAARTANKGTIKLYSDSYIKIQNSDIVKTTSTSEVDATLANVYGRIDNSGKGALEFANDAATEKQEVYAVLNNATVEDIVALNTARYSYNTLQFTGTLTLDKDFADVEGFDQTNLAKITTYEFVGTTVDLKDAPKTGVGAAFTTARISGNVTFKGFTKTESVLNLYGATPKIVMGLGSSLTVKNMTMESINNVAIKVEAGFTSAQMTAAEKTKASTVVDMTAATVTDGVSYDANKGVLYTVK